MEPPSTAFALQTSFPPVIFSYCTKTDGGRGEQRMWQIANFLKKHGIASFNGKQVEVGEDWMQKWLGKMPEADVCLALISGPYFESGPCKEEIYKTAREKIPILPIIFETPPPLKKGFFGTSVDERENASSSRSSGTGCRRPTRTPWSCRELCIMSSVRPLVAVNKMGDHDRHADGVLVEFEHGVDLIAREQLLLRLVDLTQELLHVLRTPDPCP